jgi:hypothetical protein
MDSGLLSAFRNANNVVGMAQRRGYPLPDDFAEMKAIYQEAVRPVPVPGVAGLPVKATATAKHIQSVAQDRMIGRERAVVAREVASAAARAVGLGVQAACPGYGARLADELAGHIETVARLLTSAPRIVDGLTSADAVAEHQALLRAVESVNLDVIDRRILGPLLADPDTARPWLYLAPEADVTVFTVRAALADFALRDPVTVDDWERVVSIGVQLASSQDLDERAQWWAGVEYAAGWGSPDGGLLDKTIAQATAMAGYKPWGRPPYRLNPSPGSRIRVF